MREAAWAALACLAACGGATSSVQSPEKASEFCDQALALSYAAEAQCYGGTVAQWTELLGDLGCSAVDEAVADHRATYDRVRAGACLAELAKPVDCGDFGHYGSCTSRIIFGNVPAGQPCDESLQCAVDALCMPLPTDTDSCARSVCQVIPTLGQHCDFLCGPGLTCSVDQICIANGKWGSTCGGPTDPSCDSGFQCGATGRCVAKVKDGACVGSSECFEYQFCDVTTHRCRDRLEVGEDCSGDPASCDAFLYCEATTHACAQGGHVGEGCGGFFGAPLLCVEGFCDGADRDPRCVTEIATGAPNGAACTLGFECATQLCVQGQCAAACP